MAFLYPAFLFALAAVAVPIAIHLFNLRRFKKVYFSDLRFLREVQIQTRSRNRIRNLLILLARCAAIAALVLAFAQPVIPHGELTADDLGGTPILFIDNSFSMDAVGEEGQLLEAAKARALAVTDAFRQSRGLGLLTHDFAGAEGRTMSMTDVRQAIAEVGVSSRSRSMADVLRRADAISGAEGTPEVYIFSDLQKHHFDGLTEIGTEARVYIVPLRPNTVQNLSVDSVWLVSPVRLLGQYDEARARIRNSGTERATGVNVRLSLNGQQKAMATIDIEAGSYEEVTLGYTPERAGPQYIDVAVTDHPITFDDSYHLSYTLTPKVNVLDIRGSDAVKAFNDLYSSDQFFNYSAADAGGLDLSTLSRNDLIILNGLTTVSTGLLQECRTLAADGGSVIWAPATNGLEASNTAAQVLGTELFSAIDTGRFQAKELAMQSLIFQGVFTKWKERMDLPSAKRMLRPVGRTDVVREDLLRTSAAEPLLSTYTVGQGKVHMIMAPLAEKGTTLTRHALFVPIFYNMAAYSRLMPYSALRTDSESGTLVRLAQGIARESVRVTALTDGSQAIPEVRNEPNGQRLHLHGEVRQAGHYLITAGSDTIGTLSLNYPEQEGRTEYLTADGAAEALRAAGVEDVRVVDEVRDRLANAISERHSGTPLWRYMLLFALLMLAFETILIRTAK